MAKGIGIIPSIMSPLVGGGWTSLSTTLCPALLGPDPFRPVFEAYTLVLGDDLRAK